MEAARKRILSIHGTVAVVAGTVLAILSTIGAISGAGVFKFLQQDKLVHAGLLQAYLLFALIGFVLITASRQDNARKWNRVGAAAHVLILIAYVCIGIFLLQLKTECLCVLVALSFIAYL